MFINSGQNITNISFSIFFLTCDRGYMDSFVYYFINGHVTFSMGIHNGTNDKHCDTLPTPLRGNNP